MERVKIGDYYFRINYEKEIVEKVKEVNSSKNDEDFEIENYYVDREQALSDLENY